MLFNLDEQTTPFLPELSQQEAVLAIEHPEWRGPKVQPYRMLCW